MVLLKQHQTNNVNNNDCFYILRMTHEQPNLGDALQAISTDINITKIANK